MKKLISIIAAAALVFALAVPAMAATSSPSPSGGDVVSSASSTSDDYLVRILPAAPTQEELSALSVRAAEIGGETEYSTDCVSVEIVNHAGAVVTSQYFQENTAVLVSFVRNDASEVLAVLAWNAATHTWDSVSFIQDGSSVFATFPHLCNVAFVVNGLEDGSASSSTAGSATDSGAAAAGTAADGTTSAQTGYTAIVWIALAVVAVAGACICFRTSKKSVVSAA
ncbi:MAG: hypothetical protein K6A37_07255 [Saccharofermentans sp.]|nr:hypothetical protein [Saccharofermentans sp.]